MEKEIICPLKLQGCLATGDDQNQAKERSQCLRSKCAWYVTIYNAENYPENHCAVAAIAMKNAEGKIMV